MNNAGELYKKVSDILQATAQQQNKLLHETLVLACHEGLKDTHHSFGNLSSQVESLCRYYNIPPKETLAIQRMRRHSNTIAPILPNDLLYDCRSLALFISYIFKQDIPHFLTGRLPDAPQQCSSLPIANYKYIRCSVRSWNEKLIYVTVHNQESEDELLSVDYKDTPQYIDFSYLAILLRKGMQLNLIDCDVKGKKVFPRNIVIEPDYLLDISTIANCFEDYGHHPLLYTLQRFSSRPCNKYTILGNFAGAALDDIINKTSFSLSQTIYANFRDKALDFATATDFDSAEFKQNAAQQVANMQQIVKELFNSIDRAKAILEPSFICEELGIQGRVDLMTTDMQLLVEQKSGKNIYIERKGMCNRYGSIHIEKHYVQVLLYFGILSHNFSLSPRKTKIHLLYSKYPLPDGLIEIESLQKLIFEAIKYRNQVVATEFWIAQNGFEKVLPHLTPETLNVEKLSSRFFYEYKLPMLINTLTPLHALTPLEKAYFTRMVTFVIREQIISKVGIEEGVGNSGADLWNMPLSMKKDTGNIFTELSIKSKKQSGIFNGYDIITLNVPTQADDFLPNFRRGDMVYLYAYPRGKEPDVRKSILFKGVITEIRLDEVTVKLNDGQQNKDIIKGDFFAIEHASSDVMANTALRSLYTFITSSKQRRDLLLGRCAPRVDLTKKLSRSYHSTYDNIILKAKQAMDYFLLVGPPGTGKTSKALQFLVREALAEKADSNLLLLSYTNRAVDEICSMLSENGIDYIRIGNKFSCNPLFIDHLLTEKIAEETQLKDIKDIIFSSRVIVCTTSTLASHTNIFHLKTFDLAIIDEASQILEPNIVGILSEKSKSIKDKGEKIKLAITKFILIGDYKQLPAIVQQPEQDAKVEDASLKDIGLHSCAISLFERLISIERKAGREQFIDTLRKQGRMHPDIAAFPNKMFYIHEKIECVPLKHQKEANLPYKKQSRDYIDDFIKVHRMIFISSKSCRELNISDKTNVEEARIVADLLKRIYYQTSDYFDAEKTIGVIVPYRNQIAMIRKEIEKLNIPSIEKISIDTVERYQGSQRDVIIYSFTIQQRYQLDFLTANTFVEDNDTVIDRKLNVAITRARKQMIMIGNEATLRENAIFSALIEHVKQAGGYMQDYKESKSMSE